MKLNRALLERLIFDQDSAQRFLQDSPVLPDVWIAYGEAYTDPAVGRGATVDLLLEPHRRWTAGELYRVIRRRLNGYDGRPSEAGRADESQWWGQVRPGSQAAIDANPPSRSLAYTEGAIVGRLTLGELVAVLLPTTDWWRRLLGPRSEKSPAVWPPEAIAGAAGSLPEPLRWLVRFVGALELARRETGPSAEANFEALASDEAALVGAFLETVETWLPEEPASSARLYQVARNRVAKPAVSRSTLAVKADAARRLFEVSCARLVWAVIDTGVDAAHPAFRARDAAGHPYPAPWVPAGQRWTNQSRVLATYDFSRIRDLISSADSDADWRLQYLRANEPPPGSGKRAAWERDLRFWTWRKGLDPSDSRRIDRLRECVIEGLPIDWQTIEPLLRVAHDVPSYRPPGNSHGTHVAGILASDWQAREWPATPPAEDDLVGVCPDLRLYDLRVFDDTGKGDEFNVIAAIQFIRFLNTHRGVTIHGVNLSLSIHHDVANFACGRTPVCDECDRLVSNGVVVVAAAGNDGYGSYGASSLSGGPDRRVDGYRSISITDPGNSASVITVGSTHRFAPHAYGVSYFSSRGPTGDGRLKPDLVAPGEKILAPVPGNGEALKDGTSMAAPHVSGAAALLMARHRELIGQPQQIKSVLCATATDLGRERYFQGAGMLDILRALQQV